MATEFEYDCDKEAGILADPNEHKRIGYVTSLSGFGVTLAQDMRVHFPFKTSAAPGFRPLTYTAATAKSPMATATVAGVLSNFSWGGAICDPIKLEFWISQENALLIKQAQAKVLPTTMVKTLSWWIGDYDQESKCWFEQAYPKTVTGAILGVVNVKDEKGRELALEVAAKPEPARPDVDVMVYNVKLDVVPAGIGKAALYFAASTNKSTVRNWGLKLGSSSSSTST